MSSFEYEGYGFNLTSFREFVNEYNIYNNQRASAENLNKAVNKLKREVNQLIGQFKILTSKESIRWDAGIVYEAGEIVSYLTSKNPSLDEVKNSYYLALPHNYENIGYYPDKNPDFWLKITLNDLYPWLDTDNYPSKEDNKEDWVIDSDFDVINLKYLRGSLEQFKQFLDGYLAGKYIKQDNTIDLNITKPTHITTKKYVDKEIDRVENGITSITKQLKDYLYVDPVSKQLKNIAGFKNQILTTDGGFLPGKHLVSNLGSNIQQFKAMYAQDFIGTALKAKYADLAEIYKTDKTFEIGTILGIDKNGDISEFDVYKHKRPLGAVSYKPGFILNNEEKGVIIALKGQTPVKVKGKVEIGDEIYAEYDGIGTANPLDNSEKYFIGIALEAKETFGLGLVNTKV